VETDTYWRREAISSQSDEVEFLCDICASELLFPQEQVAKLITETSRELETILSLAESFDASLEAAAIKFTEQTENRLAVLFAETMFKPKDQQLLEHLKSQQSFFSMEPEKKLRIRLATVSQSWDGPCLPTYASIPESSSIFQAYHDGQRLTRHTERLEINGAQERCHLDAYPCMVRWGDEFVPKILAVIRLM